MRGKLTIARSLILLRRLIPAHAGKTLSRATQPILGRAHPRACGENSERHQASRIRSGSSPRMRGKLFAKLKEIACAGLIPAHAGKTARSSRHPRLSAAHPRARGENERVSPANPPSSGSSPRMRGKRPMPVFLNSGLGLIPAHAGKTRCVVPAPGC